MRDLPPPKNYKPALKAIPGSRFLRAFCRGCEDPIRVTSWENNYCSECVPTTKLARTRYYNVDIDWGGYCDTPINE